MLLWSLRLLPSKHQLQVKHFSLQILKVLHWKPLIMAVAQVILPIVSSIRYYESIIINQIYSFSIHQLKTCGMCKNTWNASFNTYNRNLSLLFAIIAFNSDLTVRILNMHEGKQKGGYFGSLDYFFLFNYRRRELDFYFD